MRKIIFFIILNLLLPLSVIFSQEEKTETIKNKIPLDHSVYESWKRMEKARISNNGEWVSYEINPQKGDGLTVLLNIKTGEADTIHRAYDLTFSPNNDFAAFKIKPQEDSTRKAKLNKKKKEDMPKDSLGILTFDSLHKIQKVPFLKSFSIPKENTSVVVFLNENKTDKKDTVSKNTTDIYDFTIYNPLGNKKRVIKSVTDYSLSKNGELVAFSELKKGKTDISSLFIFNTKDSNIAKIFHGKGSIKNIIVDDNGKQAAFIYTEDTIKTKKYGLYYWNNELTESRLVIDSSTLGLPDGWDIPENTSLKFSEDGSKLFLRTAVKSEPEPKDTLLDEEKFKVDIWNWNDPKLQTEQIKNLDADKKKTYIAVWNIPVNAQLSDKQKIFQLSDTLIDEVKLTTKGNGNLAIGYSYKPYLKLQSWEEAEYKDVYLLNLKTGEKKFILSKIQFGAELSPKENYVVYYETSDSSWHSYNINIDESFSITKSINVKFGDELFDLPAQPNPYGFGSWTENDESVLIYDRYDIWKLSLNNSFAPVNLTNSRNNKIIFRYTRLEEEKEFLGKNEEFLLRGTDEVTYSEAFYFADLDNGVSPNSLISMDNHFSEPLKAKKTDKIIWMKSAYTEFPDLWYSNLDYTGIKRLSDANPQMKNYLWGTVEIINWKNFAGEDMRGLLYKPENFDAAIQYPMIVYFYEKYTSNKNAHYIPNPSRSVINFPLYNSTGYLIFIPDITYKIGYPGESAYNAIMSGTQYLIDQGFVDKERLGLQGQSWGGYQSAFLVTQTSLFKAAMAGAPVSNMTSAYGGIRWESGKNRIFQYETGQSRIGGTLWEKLDLYIKNSPLFFADKVTTPLLIMANDTDGAVPYQEGMLYFVSLRRLGKPAWLLSYNGDEHNLTKWPNRKDLSIRMKQFFDHYLMGAPAPAWMEDGIPALEKGKKTGYDLK